MSPLSSRILNNFTKEQDAAITVDWVVLTAALVIIALAAVLIIQTGLESSANTLTGSVSTAVAAGLS